MWADHLKSLGRAALSKSFFYGLGNWALSFAGFVMLARGVWLAFTDVTSGLALLGAGAALIFAGSIDRFEFLKALGLEARTRELGRKIDQAEVITGHLQELAAVAYGSLIAQGAKAGRWDSAPSFEELHTLACNSRSQMQALGVSEGTRAKALAPWVDMAIHDWMRTALAPLFQGLHRVYAGSAANKERYDAAVQALFRTHARESLGTLAGFLAEFESAAPDATVDARRMLQDWSAELEHLIQKQELQTPSRWYEFIK